MTNERLLAYDTQRAICRAYEKMGHTVEISLTNRGTSASRSTVAGSSASRMR